MLYNILWVEDKAKSPVIAGKILLNFGVVKYFDGAINTIYCGSTLDKFQVNILDRFKDINFLPTLRSHYFFEG